MNNVIVTVMMIILLVFMYLIPPKQFPIVSFTYIATGT